MDEIEKLVEDLRKYNEAYREGEPIITDAEYDELVEKLRLLAPDNSFLQSVEPEKFEGKKEIKHPFPMLSTEKAYSKDDLLRFLNRIKKESEKIGIETIVFKITPKLDGLAGRDDGTILVTRGNGIAGYDITNAFDKGIIPIGGRGLGLGEIVILKSYFDENLSEYFEHPRNMVVGIIASDNLNEFAKEALQNEAVHFVPYKKLPCWEGNSEELINKIEEITEDILKKTDYPLDGMIVELTNETLKKHLGATAHHYRWQIAVKKKGDTAVTTVKKIKWQVGRTGNVTPVLEVTPTSLSGATIKNVTAHHAGLIKEQHIGIGSEIEIIRSGEVIPKLIKVITKTEDVKIPELCPSCKSELKWNNDFLKCLNIKCPSQIEQSISHWFKTLGNADWFGIKTIQKLVNQGFDSLEKIYDMKEDDFIKAGFGPGQSKNLFEAINISKNKMIEDWRFLAAFGISNLGKGESKRLLSYIKLEDILSAKIEDIQEIKHFGTITSQSIVAGILSLKPTILYMLNLGFNLERTPLISEISNIESPIKGKKIVFTGKMAHGTREEMQNQASKLGAILQTSVTSKTDFLVCGENVGASKIDKAKKAGVKIVSELDYHEIIKNF
ncbi:MAG: DNA ligase [Desulfobacterales bacterium]|nr:DNA ligase [Desulfobacterales bacterium]